MCLNGHARFSAHPLDVFDLFAEDHDQPKPPDWRYIPLHALNVVKGQFGRFARLTCLADEPGQEFSATCDAKYFEHLRPYAELLSEHQRTPGLVEHPVIPVFLGDDGKWRFSWRGAEHDYPQLRKSLVAPNRVTGTPDRPYRLQVTVSPELAQQFKQTAASKGLTHNEYLLDLVRKNVSFSG